MDVSLRKLLNRMKVPVFCSCEKPGIKQFCTSAIDCYYLKIKIKQMQLNGRKEYHFCGDSLHPVDKLLYRENERMSEQALHLLCYKCLALLVYLELQEKVYRDCSEGNLS